MMMDKGMRTGILFGATSKVITTIGLMVGLQGRHAVAAVFGGVVVIAISDPMPDALGIYLAREADPESTRAHIWAATLWTFVSKFLLAISFALPLNIAPARSGGAGRRDLGAGDSCVHERLPRPHATDRDVAGGWGACDHRAGRHRLVPLRWCAGTLHGALMLRPGLSCCWSLKQAI
jgi:hypothetical protein